MRMVRRPTLRSLFFAMLVFAGIARIAMLAGDPSYVTAFCTVESALFTALAMGAALFIRSRRSLMLLLYATFVALLGFAYTEVLFGGLPSNASEAPYLVLAAPFYPFLIGPIVAAEWMEFEGNAILTSLFFAGSGALQYSTIGLVFAITCRVAPRTQQDVARVPRSCWLRAVRRPTWRSWLFGALLFSCFVWIAISDDKPDQQVYLLGILGASFLAAFAMFWALVVRRLGRFMLWTFLGLVALFVLASTLPAILESCEDWSDFSFVPFSLGPFLPFYFVLAVGTARIGVEPNSLLDLLLPAAAIALGFALIGPLFATTCRTVSKNLASPERPPKQSTDPIVDPAICPDA